MFDPSIGLLDSDSVNLGSNPSPPANLFKDLQADQKELDTLSPQVRQNEVATDRTNAGTVTRRRTLFPIMEPSFGNDLKRIRTSGVYMLKAIPWSMIKPHEDQARKNHGQTLMELAARGGLSACEAVAVLEDRQWFAMEVEDAYRRLHDLFVTAAEADAPAPFTGASP